MRVYHFLTAKYGLEAILNLRIKLARFDEMNDPFELYGAVFPHSTQRTHEILRDRLRSFGVLCLTRGWQNPVLWAHYADRHRGVCLGFDVPDELALEVKYVDSVQTVASDFDEKHPFSEDEAVSQLIERAEKFWKALALTKYSWWRYEDEVRLFSEARPDDRVDGMDFINFGPYLELKEVVLGVRVTQETAEHVRSVTSTLDTLPVVLRTRTATDRFDIVKDKTLF